MGVLQVETAAWMSEDLKVFEGEARKFMERECVPHSEKWIKHNITDRAITFNKILRKLWSGISIDI